MTRLEDLLAGPVLGAAQGLLGRRLLSTAGGRTTSVVLTEVEAYDGADDPASHAFNGPTERNQSMFEAPGTLYVYRSYGIHWCMNITCGPVGTAAAVLLRGGRISEGRDVIERRRGRSDHLVDGPGKLTQALGVTGDLDGTSVIEGGELLLGEVVAEGTTVAGPRIGISKGIERPWRLVLEVRD